MHKTHANSGINVWCIAVLCLVCLAYANHFSNDFHFDDSHTVQNNPWIRDIGNIPRFFTDGTTFSTLPANRTYRPLISASLAIDYRLSGGLNPVWFHISTFLWFLLQLVLMFALFRFLLDRLAPPGDPQKDNWNPWIALAATAFYGLHPAMAETVNYIIQRGDLYVALGIVASLYWYFARPDHRKFYLYLIPLTAAMLAKPPAMVMPLLLIAALCFMEGEKLGAALRKAVPSFICVALAGWFVSAMTPKGYSGGSSSAYGYLITQPSVLLHYFQTYFLPTGLTVDTDRPLYGSLFEGDALVGFLFLAVLIAVIVYCSSRRTNDGFSLGPIAFGLSWFLIASLPTSLFPLAEVDNDHRMFLPFVGLTLSVVYSGALLIRRYSWRQPVALTLCILAAGGFAWGTRQRNRIWRTDEALWLDNTVKSPKNGRGLMNYGLTQMAKGGYPLALEYFERALALTPNYYVLEVNLGIVNGEMGRPAEAERHFLTAQRLAPSEMTTHFFFARWLNKVGRTPEAVAQLRSGIAVNPDFLDARYLLMQILGNLGDSASLAEAAKDTLGRFPSDTVAADWLNKAPGLRAAPPVTTVPQALPGTPPGAPPAPIPAATEAALVEQSLAMYRLGRYEECIQLAQVAIKVKPNSSAAWNNIGACYNQMKAWARAIPALEQAIRIQPDFQLAKNNLAWAKSELAGAAGKR